MGSAKSKIVNIYLAIMTVIISLSLTYLVSIAAESKSSKLPPGGNPPPTIDGRIAGMHQDCNEYLRQAIANAKDAWGTLRYSAVYTQSVTRNDLLSGLLNIEFYKICRGLK
ncbi:MAG: hypothetical protein AAB930_00625 [Patescibacteria group bacterium]